MPVPTLSVDDPNYSPEGHYWIGGVWAPTNYMITRGLERAGEGDLAHEIAMKYLHGLAKVYREEEPPSLWEAYAPELNGPAKRPYDEELVKFDFVGWSAIGPIAMLIENVMGIVPDMANNEISWELRLTERHGVEELHLGETTVRFIAKERGSADAPVEIEASSSTAITLKLRCGNRSLRQELQPGERTCLLL
jgi:glycogen debranching enzyme